MELIVQLVSLFKLRCSVVFLVFSSGLCPDWETWDPTKKVENASEAMQLADDWLGIPQVSVCCDVRLMFAAASWAHNARI